jgi:hypothetical protein
VTVTNLEDSTVLDIAYLVVSRYLPQVGPATAAAIPSGTYVAKGFHGESTSTPTSVSVDPISVTTLVRSTAMVPGTTGTSISSVAQ